MGHAASRFIRGFNTGSGPPSNGRLGCPKNGNYQRRSRPHAGSEPDAQWVIFNFISVKKKIEIRITEKLVHWPL